MFQKISLTVLYAFLTVAMAVAQEPNPQLPLTYIDTTYTQPGGAIWQAHTSTDFENAINSAKPGDVIVLDAGTIYSGNFILPAKTNPGNQWIYIISSALSSLPAGTRVSPTVSGYMPKVVTPNTTAAISLSPGANHYRLAGLELYSASNYGCKPGTTPPTNCWSYHLIGSDSKPGQTLVDSITVDRSYLHGSPTKDIRQGIIANGSNFAVVDSYISDIHLGTDDSQAILAYFSPGPLKIVNNFLSATTEEVMFGGAGGVNNPYVPSDIEMRNNHLWKNPAWAAVGVTIPPNLKWGEKNNLEMKSARRALIDGNVFENTWVSGQVGYSVLLTVRTSSSGNGAVVDDITLSNNVFKNVQSGVLTGEHDSNCSSTPGCTSSGEVQRIKIYDNLFLFRDPKAVGGTTNLGILISQDLTDLVAQHNTFVSVPTSPCHESIFFNNLQVPPPASTAHNAWVLDNAMCREITGNGGYQGTKGLNYYMSDPNPVNPRFYGNAMYVQPGDTLAQFPPHNYATTVPFTYVNSATGNYQLSIPNWTDTSDGQIAGVNSAALPSF